MRYDELEELGIDVDELESLGVDYNEHWCEEDMDIEEIEALHDDNNNIIASLFLFGWLS